MSSAEKLPEILGFLRSREMAMVHILKRFARCESPTDSKPAVDHCGRTVAVEWGKRGAKVEYLPRKDAGNHLRIIWPANPARPAVICPRPGQILVLGHLDTVYEAGTIKKMPFRVARGRAFGPGVFDMKGGLVIALFAVDALVDAAWLPQRRIVFLWTSDEETGSKSSREVIEHEARRSAAVLVLEPANGPEGQLKTRRKATGTAELVISGRAAHAGLDPRAGVNAVHELALQAARLMRLNNPRRGITVNPTIAQGGTRSNVIPAEARLTTDLRAETLADMRRIERKLKTLRPILRGARVAVTGGFSRPPLERRASAALFSHARKLAQQLGFSVGECLAGGGSDGNFTAALGVPTLDGLGAVGEAPHSPDEQVIISALPERAALLAALLATL
ncbi:MAG: peptidase M20 [Acidobacteria bacterium]|nr:MAG: peptidase M20 [Acidobacteriota bacterium]